MRESNVIIPTYSILLPYVEGIAGLMTELILQVNFEAEERDGEIVSIRVTTLTGTNKEGRIFDMIHLVEDGDGNGIDNNTITVIVGNRAQWDKPTLWWLED